MQSRLRQKQVMLAHADLIFILVHKWSETLNVCHLHWMIFSSSSMIITCKGVVCLCWLTWIEIYNFVLSMPNMESLVTSQFKLNMTSFKKFGIVVKFYLYVVALWSCAFKTSDFCPSYEVMVYVMGNAILHHFGNNDMFLAVVLITF